MRGSRSSAGRKGWLGPRNIDLRNLEIYYSDRHTQGKIPKFEFKFEEQSSLGDNMAKAFNNLEYSDVTIICGDETEEVPNVAAAAASASPSAS